MCQSNSTRPDVLEMLGKYGVLGVWVYRVMCQFNSTRPDLLEMLGKCGMLGVQ